MADIDRLAIFIERLFHDIDGAHDPGAKAAWLGKDYAHLKRSDPVFPAVPPGSGPAAAALQHHSFPYPRRGRNPFLGMGKMRDRVALRRWLGLWRKPLRLAPKPTNEEAVAAADSGPPASAGTGRGTLGGNWGARPFCGPKRGFMAADTIQAFSSSLGAAIAASARSVDATLDGVLPRPEGAQARLTEAMRYATFAGGKRLRPFLVLHSARLFGVDDSRALRVGAAIEALHTYSLVHDDLPCMDDDDLRRGRPTTHIAFDEMTAVLAGDALLTIAFEILADGRTHPDADIRIALVARLAEASGHAGMIGGQIIDMLAEQREAVFGMEEIVNLQRLKTGQLFEFACEAGPILGRAPGEDRARLRAYAAEMGVVFQITDDLLDVTSTAEKTGKKVGKDAGAGKATLVTLLGIDGARAEAEARARRAVEALGPHAARAPELAQLPRFLIGREA
jgi:farnesyl diphosphate synthase